MIETIMKVATPVLAVTGTTIAVVDLVKINKANASIGAIDKKVDANKTAADAAIKANSDRINELNKKLDTLNGNVDCIRGSIAALNAWCDAHMRNNHPQTQVMMPTPAAPQPVPVQQPVAVQA